MKLKAHDKEKPESYNRWMGSRVRTQQLCNTTAAIVQALHSYCAILRLQRESAITDKIISYYFVWGNYFRQLLQETLQQKVPGGIHQCNVMIGAVLPWKPRLIRLRYGFSLGAVWELMIVMHLLFYRNSKISPSFQNIICSHLQWQGKSWRVALRCGVNYSISSQDPLHYDTKNPILQYKSLENLFPWPGLQRHACHRRRRACVEQKATPKPHYRQSADPESAPKPTKNDAKCRNGPENDTNICPKNTRKKNKRKTKNWPHHGIDEHHGVPIAILAQGIF